MGCTGSRTAQEVRAVEEGWEAQTVDGGMEGVEKSGPSLNPFSFLFFFFCFSFFSFLSADVIKCLCHLYWLSGQHTHMHTHSTQQSDAAQLVAD